MNSQEKLKQLANLVNMESPYAVLEEVKRNFIHFFTVDDFKPVRGLYNFFLDLFEGRYPGYRECDTLYHDKYHSMDTLLAFSRLGDGYMINEGKLPVTLFRTGLASSLLHDSGYIQKEGEEAGTGAKYTKDHVRRSISMLSEYFSDRSPAGFDLKAAENIILCTELQIDIESLNFGSDEEKLIGYMVGTADLLGQMSSRTYLEKLLYLYSEFDEAGIKDYDSEYNLLEKTFDFYDEVVKNRLDKLLGGVYKYARSHFRDRYGIDENLYIEAIERQLEYLRRILRDSTVDTYKEMIRRVVKGTEDKKEEENDE